MSLIAPPFAAPTAPQDPQLGGLRFVLRVENPRHRQAPGLPRLTCCTSGGKNGGKRGHSSLPLPPNAVLAFHKPTFCRRGYAEETYVTIVPRHPASPNLDAAGRLLLGLPGLAGAPVEAVGEQEEEQRGRRHHGLGQRQQREVRLPANQVAPERQGAAAADASAKVVQMAGPPTPRPAVA